MGITAKRLARRTEIISFQTIIHDIAICDS